MLKKLLLTIAALAAFGQSLLGDDYYNYGQYPMRGYSAGGFIDTHGKLGEPGKEYVFHINGNVGYIHRVDTEGDPQMHPDNPDATGPVTKRTFTLISSHTISNAAPAANSFHIDDSGIYYGPRRGIKRWDFDWGNETTVVATNQGGQSFARNTRTGDFWYGDRSRRIYKWDGHQWVYQFTYPNLGGGHHDGMTITNDTLFLSDMTSDFIATYKLDKQGNVINPSAPDHIYKYSASPAVENMGFGPNNHIWITSGSVIYEIGGGKLQEQLASCSQELILSNRWEMLSSRCDIKNATGFHDTVILKKVGNILVAISDNNQTLNYYRTLGYETNTSLSLFRGEGFWIRAENNGTRHTLNGAEETVTIQLKKGTTRFIGFPDYHLLDLDEVFGDKPVKEIRYWDTNISTWRKWQPNHAKTDLTTISDSHGFYICIADDFNISLPNLSPIAKISGDTNITIGETVHLDGSSSFDRDGKIISYKWEEGNTTLSTDKVLEKDDFELGWHKVVLTVTDNDGATGSIETIVRIMHVNTLPTVNLGHDRNSTQGETVQLSPEVSDPDGFILSYEWRLDGNVIATTPYVSLENLSVGEHNVTLEVIDNDLGHAKDALLVTVVPVPDTTPPQLILIGANPMVINLGDTFVDPGAIAVDDRDGNLTVDTNGSVDSSVVGTYVITYRAQDAAGNGAQTSRDVIVQDPAANRPPHVDAGDDRTISEGESVVLQASASDDDGSIARMEWKHEEQSLGTGSQITVENLPVGDHVYTIIATDNDGAVASDSVRVHVLPRTQPDTTPPVITILGNNPAIVQKGDSYTDAGATAVDDRDGNVSVGYEYNITTSKPGVYLVTYTASDHSGNRATAQRSVLVRDHNDSTPDTTPPVITLLGSNPFEITQNEPFNDPGVVVVDDHDGQLGYSMRHNVDSSRVGKYRVIYNAADQAGNRAEANRTVIVRDPNGNRPPHAHAGADQVVGVGAVVHLDGSESIDDDGEIVSYLWQEGNVTLSQEAIFELGNLSRGSHHLILKVTDNEGASATDTVTIRVIDPSDTTPPVAAISAPAENAKVTLQTEIVGTASDENLDYYSLSVSPVGKDTYAEIARGTASVTDGVLGTLDATTLLNGIYDLKLTVVDENGARTEAYTKVIIDGKAKIGNFSFTVRDFDIKVGGIPVQVNRTYSTLQRFKKSDFTYGWSIDYQNVKVEKTIHPGKNWAIETQYINTPLGSYPLGLCFKTHKHHIVNISLPDGSSEKFEYKFARECDYGYNYTAPWDAPILEPLNGSEAKLEVIDASSTVFVTQQNELLDTHTLEPYNPSLYRLTLANGMVYEISENEGIRKIRNLRGETLTYTANGIESSRGESLSFERDAQNRIVKITDLAGKSVQYHYNENDDMDYVIDQMGYSTNYYYQAGHLLEEYIDPSGKRLTKNEYDAQGRLIRTTDADGYVTEFTHDIDGREEIVRDKLGRVHQYVYDEAGNVLSQTNPMGETTTHTYDAKGRELSMTDPLGHTTTNTYDAKGNLLSTTDALGNTETTTYNDKGSPTSISDKNGNRMTVVYDNYNAPTSITTANGATTTFTYDNFNNKKSATNEYNQTTTYQYDIEGNILSRYSKGNILKETRPDGTVITHTYDKSSNLLTTTTTYPDGTQTTTSNTYDAFNRLTSTTDERGNTTTYEYDARGNKVSMTDIYGLKTMYEYNAQNKLTKTTYSDGTTELNTYDAMGNLLSETDKEGHTTTYEYDGADRLIKTTYPDGSTVTKTYDAAGRVTSTTDQRGNTTTYEYDAVGNKIAQTDALGHKTTYSYDPQGNLLSVTDALGQTTRYEYNALNQRIKTIYPDGSITTQSMNISGLPASKTDEAGHTTQYGYDTNATTLPKLSGVTLANGATTHYTYDAQGHKTSQTDALGHTTQWHYEPTGEINSQTLPGGERKTYTYSPKGLVVQTTDFAGKAQTFVYNRYKQLVRIEYSDGHTLTYAYTPSGRVKSLTDSLSGTITNTYDAMGRLKTRTNAQGETITYTYDEVGNITKIETPTQSISKTYDALNRLKSVTDTQGTTTYEYDAIGRQTKVTYPSGVSTEYSYDSRNRVTKIEHKKSDGTVLQSFAYTYDAVGNPVKVVENTGRTVTYEYNSVNQLIKETVSNDPDGNNTVTTFAYDQAGNLVSKTIGGITTEYSYDADGKLIQKGSITYTYDANGNLIDDGTNSYEYDDKNRLVKVTTPTQTIEYTYDADDHRIAKVVRIKGIRIKGSGDANAKLFFVILVNQKVHRNIDAKKTTYRDSRILSYHQ